VAIKYDMTKKAPQPGTKVVPKAVLYTTCGTAVAVGMVVIKSLAKGVELVVTALLEVGNQ